MEYKMRDFLLRWFDIYSAFKKYDPVKKCEVYRLEGCSHVDGFLCDMKTCTTLEQYRNNRNKNTNCPVCGYYCLGTGGIGCIDKPSLVKCGHGKSLNDYCEPCGRVNGG